MPDNPTYIHKLAEILTGRAHPNPSLFSAAGTWRLSSGLKKRQAVNLMHRIGAVRVSRELAVEQRDLAAWLEQMAADPSVTMEQRRHETVIGRIVELKAETAARAVKIVLPDGPSVEIPAGVSFQPGVLTVSFDNERQLLERLFLLARVFATQPQVLNNLSLPR